MNINWNELIGAKMVRESVIAVAEKESIPDLVKSENIGAVNDIRSKIAHLEKISRLKRETHKGSMSSNTVEALWNRDFIWFVDNEFISRFKYAASLGLSTDRNEFAAVTGKIKGNFGEFQRADIVYKADMPDIVADRALLARELGINYFTVHSHHPLPVEFVLPQVDPVLIGWETHPVVYKNFERSPHGNFQCAKDALGVVIAVWEGENEVDII